MGSESQREMSSPCIREASKACFKSCCTSPFALSQNHPNTPSESSTVRLNEFTTSTLSSLSRLNSNFTNHESLPSLAESFSIFEKAYPQFAQTTPADEIRSRDFPHLSLSSHVCLDYIGHSLFTGVPLAPSTSSSSNPPLDSNSSKPFFDIVYKSVTLNLQVHPGKEELGFESKIQKRIFEFMNLSQDDYTMVFTANKSSALELLAVTYPFSSRRKLLTVYDHKSEAIDTMIVNAAKRGAINKNAEFLWPNFRIQGKKLMYLVRKKKTRKNKGLFVFPLQSSVSGARYSYLWMSLARENGWNVLLDASALGAKDMETLGLSLFQPDFLFCSFYKVFGENPSGFGCLFMKKSAVSVLDDSKRVGIVNLIPPRNSKFWELTNMDLIEHSDQSSEIREIEEPNMAVEELEFKGLDHADSLGLIIISTRAKYLVNWLVNALMRLKHPNSENGLLLVRIYGPKIQLERGPALAFNIFDWKGEKIDPELVQKLADRHNISLRSRFLKHIHFSDNYKEEKGRLIEKISKKENFSGFWMLILWRKRGGDTRRLIRKSLKFR